MISMKNKTEKSWCKLDRDQHGRASCLFAPILPGLPGFFYGNTKTTNLKQTQPCMCRADSIYGEIMKEAQRTDSYIDPIILQSKVEKIKEKLENERRQNRLNIAKKFLAGPSAWSDFPFNEDYEIDEEWIPLDQ